MFTPEAIAAVLNTHLLRELANGNAASVSESMGEYFTAELCQMFNDSGWSVEGTRVKQEANIVAMSFRLSDPASGSEIVKSKWWTEQELLSGGGTFTALGSLLLQEAVDELLKIVIPTHRITVSVESPYSLSRDACGDVSRLIQSKMIGEIVGQHNGKNKCGTTYEVDQKWLDSATKEFNQVVERPPMLLGGKLNSDIKELVDDVRGLTYPGADQKAFREKWGHLLTVVTRAAKELARMDLPFEEIFVIGGRVRAMTSAGFGRRDSGWFEIASPVPN